MTTSSANAAGKREPQALDAVEEAILLLKQSGPSAYGVYAAGTLGFLWALLYFWAYMSRNAMADSHLREFSLLLALAFVSVPRVSRILRAFTLPRVIAPCVLLPERPG